MHPGFYRAIEMTDIADIDAFVEMLRLDDGWEEKVQPARENFPVRSEFRCFISSAEMNERNSWSQRSKIY
jgi:hypothetical protein